MWLYDTALDVSFNIVWKGIWKICVIWNFKFEKFEKYMWFVYTLNSYVTIQSQSNESICNNQREKGKERSSYCVNCWRMFLLESEM